MKYYLVFAAIASGCVSPPIQTECSSNYTLKDRSAIFCGSIDHDTDEKFASIIDLNDIDSLVVTSSGGNVYSAIKLVELINANDVRVIARGECMSACAQYILALANDVTVERGTALGFHQNPAGTWAVMASSGIIEDTSNEKWSDLRLFAWRSSFAYHQNGVDSGLLIEPVLQLQIDCVIDELTGNYAGHDNSNLGFRTKQRKKWWVPSRDVLNAYRVSQVKGWWPANRDEVKDSYLENGIQIEASLIAYSNPDGIIGPEVLEEMVLRRCEAG